MSTRLFFKLESSGPPINIEDTRALKEAIDGVLKKQRLAYLGSYPNDLAVYDSPGEGGFLIRYAGPEGIKAMIEFYTMVRGTVHASVIPIGATGSLIHRVYSSLNEIQRATEGLKVQTKVFEVNQDNSR